MNPMIDTMAPALSPEQVLFTTLRPAQDAINAAGQRGYEQATAMVGRNFELQKQDRAFTQQRDMQTQRDQMFLDREDIRSKARVDAARQAGTNQQIKQAENALQDLGSALPPRGEMSDQQYLDSLHGLYEKASGSSRDEDTKAVYGAFNEVSKAMQKKAQLDSMVEDDAKKITAAKLNISQWVGNQDPDTAAKFTAAVQAGQNPGQALATAGLAQAYGQFASGVYEQTKNQLLSQKGYSTQLNAIQKTIDYQTQVIHNSTWGADRQGRMAPKPWASKVINDASTQFASDQEKQANAAVVNYQKNPTAENAAAALHVKSIATAAQQLKTKTDAVFSVGKSAGGEDVDLTPTIKSMSTKEDFLDRAGLILDANNQLQVKKDALGGSQYALGPGGLFYDENMRSSTDTRPHSRDVQAQIDQQLKKNVGIAMRIINDPSIPWRNPRPGLPSPNPVSMPQVPRPAAGMNPGAVFVAPPGATNGAPVSAFNGGNVLQLPQVQQALTLPPLSMAQPNATDATPADLGIGADPQTMERNIAYQQFLAQNP